MTTKELAEKLNGREYGSEISPIEEKTAKDAGLVVVFGYSDDNVELRGAINDEIGAYNGTTIYLTPTGLLQNDCDSDDCPFFKKAKTAAVALQACWDSGGYSWTFNAPFPHETFEIMEDGEKFCRGIVFALSDVTEVKP